MSSLHKDDPVGRFSGLADDYDRYRPTYPDEAIQLIIARGNLGPGSLLVDVGCGTGIPSRPFARRGIPVLGIDPNDDMRAQAERVTLPEGCPRPVYQRARAEETGLPAAVADVVLAAQSFHWFEPSAAPRGDASTASWRTALDAVFERYQQAELVTLLYQTTVYLARPK
jgi:ubiquinone/menaquinone biosynthesis C-methylase UbiE